MPYENDQRAWGSKRADGFQPIPTPMKHILITIAAAVLLFSCCAHRLAVSPDQLRTQLEQSHAVTVKGPAEIEIRLTAKLAGEKARFARLLDAELKRVTSALGTQLTGPLAVFFVDYIGHLTDHGEDEFQGIVSHGPPNPFIAVLDDEACAKTLRHELTHVAIRKLSSSVGPCIDEGIAYYVGAYHSGGFDPYLANFIDEKGLPSSSLLSCEKLPNSQLTDGSMLGWACVYWLVHHRGQTLREIAAMPREELANLIDVRDVERFIQRQNLSDAQIPAASQRQGAAK